MIICLWTSKRISSIGLHNNDNRTHEHMADGLRYDPWEHMFWHISFAQMINKFWTSCINTKRRANMKLCMHQKRARDREGEIDRDGESLVKKKKHEKRLSSKRFETTHRVCGVYVSFNWIIIFLQKLWLRELFKSKMRSTETGVNAAPGDKSVIVCDSFRWDSPFCS